MAMIDFEALRELYPASQACEELYRDHFHRGSRKILRCFVHEDKSPSMGIFDHGQRVKCHACGWSGDGVDVLGHKMRLGPGEAALELMDRFGLAHEELPSPPHKPRRESDAFSAQALGYLRERGIPGELASAAGAYESEGGLVFPVGRRYWSKRSFLPNTPKWLHAPGFRKSEALYCPPVSKPERENRIFVVEGIADALSLAARGMHAACVFGASLSDTQAARLSGAKHVVLLFDSDSAGRAATIAALPKLLRSRANLVSIGFLSGADPATSDVTRVTSWPEHVSCCGVEYLTQLFHACPGYLDRYLLARHVSVRYLGSDADHAVRCAYNEMRFSRQESDGHFHKKRQGLQASPAGAGTPKPGS